MTDYEPISFYAFATTCEDIGNTASKNLKVEILANYLKSLDDENLKVACRLLSGEISPPSEGLELQVGYSTLVSIIAELSGKSDDTLGRTYLRYGDLGDAAEEMLAVKVIEPLIRERYTLVDVEEKFRKVAGMSGKGAYHEKRQALLGLYLNMTPLESKYLTKLLTGEMRIGLVAGLVIEGVANAFNQGYEEVNETYLLTNDIGKTAYLAKLNRLTDAKLEPLCQTNFMLAEAMQTAQEIIEYFGRELICEPKLDGVRAQCHKKGEVVKIFTRRGNESTNYFPEIAEELKKIPHDYIFDGEIVAYMNDKVLPFTLLQQRLQRKEISEDLMQRIPLSLFVYDVLYFDGKSVYKEALKERKRLFEKIKFPEKVKVLEYTFINTKEEIEKMFHESVERGFEGLMLKDPESIYTVGKRGKNWVKLKKELDTLDVVIIGAERGHGKRANIFSDYIFAIWDNGELKTIGKAYSGLTDRELYEMSDRLKSMAIKDEGWRIIVNPQIVIEVAFNGIQKSNRHESGYALRFPRIVRIREDKSIEQADSLQQVEEIFRRQQKTILGKDNSEYKT
ncbi:MAG: ATP-dependent DNA ligase [Nitrososphaeria archaeon]